MCINPKIIKNRKYLPNKKNNFNPPIPKDERLRYVEVGCGKCHECRANYVRGWIIRIQEDLKVKHFGENNRELVPHFMTMTFNDESIETIKQKYKLNEPNEIAYKAIRLFSGRYMKKFKHAVRHWFISELGEENGRIHIHGILWTGMNNDEIENMWSYGWVDCGRYVADWSATYFMKYVNKFNPKYPDFKAKIWPSKKIGANYLTDDIKHKKAFNGEKTECYYTTKTGKKVALPNYYRKKIYNDDEREQLYLQFLDQPTVHINGIEVDKKDFKKIEKLKREKQELAKKLGLDGYTPRQKRTKLKPVKDIEYVHGTRIFNNNLGEDKRVMFDWNELESNFENINKLKTL